MSHKIILEHVTSYKVNLKNINMNYEYRTEWKVFGFIIREEGFYYTYSINSADLHSKERIEKDGFYISGSYVYYRPHIRFEMSSGDRHTKYFESAEQLELFIKLNSILKNATEL
jgi:hypothetical protein